VLVCSVDGAEPMITIIDARNQYNQLAVATVHEPNAPRIDQALADLAWQRANVDPTTTATIPGWQVAAEVRQARSVLATQPRAPVLLPAPHPAVVIDRDDLAAAIKPHLARLPDAITQALADADLDREHLTVTVLIGDEATVGDLHTGLADAGLTPTVITGQPHALADGAARLTHTTTGPTTATAATTRLPRTRLTLRSLAGTVILSVCSLALLLQTINTAYIYTRNWGTEITSARLPIPNVALAAALVVIAAITIANLAPTHWFTPAGLADETSTGILLRRAYLAAATAGLAVAGLWGLGVGVGVGYINGAYLRWALTAALPIAVCTALIGLVSPRIPADRLTTWLQRLPPPTLAIAAGASGVYLMRSAFTSSFPTSLTGSPATITAVGAAMLGAATAFTATRQPLIRAVTGGILALGYALVGNLDTARYLTITYIAVLIWWALTTTARTIHYALPGTTKNLNGWLSRS
jgi:hypothetical protein